MRRPHAVNWRQRLAIRLLFSSLQFYIARLLQRPRLLLVSRLNPFIHGTLRARLGRAASERH